jgi:hypothetical protein
MEEWLTNDNLQVLLSGIEKIKSKMFDNYFNKASKQWEATPRKFGTLQSRGLPTKET